MAVPQHLRLPATLAAGNIDLQGMLEVANVGFTSESLYVEQRRPAHARMGGTSSAS